MKIGVPKEVKVHEYRVGLVPASVRELVHDGHSVVVQAGAGAGIGFTDDAAVLMAAIMVHGISIGPRLILDNPELVYGMFLSMAVASVLMLCIGLLLMRAFLNLLNVPKYFIVPVVLSCCVIGAFTLNNRITDLYLLAGVGVVGYLFKKLDYPLAPLVLGVVLGPIAETNLRRAFQTSTDWTLFFTRPISAALLALAVASIVYSIVSYVRRSQQAGVPDSNS